MIIFSYLRKRANRAPLIFKTQNICKIVRIFKCHESSFVPKRVLVLTKISRYSIERIENPNLSQYQLKQKLITKGANYDAILAGHKRNQMTESQTIKTLENLNISFRIRNRHNIDNICIDWADLIIAIGGDGTFLIASNLINDINKPIIGINSNPEFSEGYLMLASKYTNNISEIFDRLKVGDYNYLMRSRIRTTLYGESIWQMPYHIHDTNLFNKSDRFYEKYHKGTKPKGDLPKVRQLPWLALNEVFIGESFSARISILHLKTDDKFQKVKSSGVCVSTGTGSSSWYKVINSLNSKTIEDVLSLSKNTNTYTKEEVKKICHDFNSKFQYPADELKLSYVIRDMIVKHLESEPENLQHHGFCKELTVRSQCCDGGLVIDGGIAVHFNVGTTAVLETLEEDRLRNIIFPD